MALDAHVCCDCYEKGRLREPPPIGIQIRIAPNGDLDFDTNGVPLDVMIAFDGWRENFACEHPGGNLCRTRLGNISLIALVRAELERAPDKFPLLLTKVVYNGVHAGDFLPIEAIPSLQKELTSLVELKCSEQSAARFVADFRAQMSELAVAALSVGKPISF